MTDKIEEIRKALEGATPGPWVVEYKHDTTRLIAGGECTMCDETYYPWVPYNDGDWHLIALAPDMARIVLEQAQEIERLRKRVEAAEDLVKRIIADPHWRTADNALWGDLCAFHRATEVDP